VLLAVVVIVSVEVVVFGVGVTAIAREFQKDDVLSIKVGTSYFWLEVLLLLLLLLLLTVVVLLAAAVVVALVVTVLMPLVVWGVKIVPY
jgi:hypothetical protein